MPTNIIKRYLEDAIAAENSFETQLNGFAREGNNSTVQHLFERHAFETRQQHKDLTERLKQLGGEPSGMKSFLAHVFNMAPKAAQMGHEKEERTSQNLLMAFAVENGEVAMYEAMAIVAEESGDGTTAQLARKIQAQEQEAADKIWNLIGPVAAEAWQALMEPGEKKEAIRRYVQDAEAAERNFEDALATFSKTGDQEYVKSLLGMMSGKARTQHERLRVRLEQIGGEPSTLKSILAHVLAFTPTSAQIGHDPEEKNTQHLMITYSAAAAEMAMYEALAAAAGAAGDAETVLLAQQLQGEEKEDHQLAWSTLERSVLDTFRKLATTEVRQ